LSEDLSETERDAQSSQDQVSDKSNAEVWPEVRLSEDSPDKGRDALPGREATTDGPDAHGARDGRVLESSEDSTRVTSNVPYGKLEETREPSAGLSKLESSRDSSKTAEDVLSGLRPERDGPDAPELESTERSSENGTDKVNNVSPTQEETLDGLDAHGLVNGEELELSEDSERVPTNAPSGERAELTRPFAGTPRLPSSRDSPTREENAWS